MAEIKNSVKKLPVIKVNSLTSITKNDFLQKLCPQGKLLHLKINSNNSTNKYEWRSTKHVSNISLKNETETDDQALKIEDSAKKSSQSAKIESAHKESKLNIVGEQSRRAATTALEKKDVQNQMKKYQIPVYDLNNERRSANKNFHGICTEHRGYPEFRDDELPMPGDKFSSRIEFLEYTNARVSKWLFYFQLQNSTYRRTDRRLQFVCCFKKTQASLKSKKFTKNSSVPYKTNCPCRVVLVKYSNEDLYQVRHVCYHHDHELSHTMLAKVPPRGHMRPIKDIKDEIFYLISQNVDRCIIYNYVHEKIGHKPSAYIRDIIYKQTFKAKRNNLAEIFSSDELDSMMLKIRELNELYGTNDTDNDEKLQEVRKKKRRKVPSLSMGGRTDESEEEYQKKSRLDETLENIQDDEEVLESVRNLQRSVKQESTETPWESWEQDNIEHLNSHPVKYASTDGIEFKKHPRIGKKICHTDKTNITGIVDAHYNDNDDNQTVSHQEIVECTDVDSMHHIDEQKNQENKKKVIIVLQNDTVHEIKYADKNNHRQTCKDKLYNNVHISEELSYAVDNNTPDIYDRTKEVGADQSHEAKNDIDTMVIGKQKTKYEIDNNYDDSVNYQKAEEFLNNKHSSPDKEVKVTMVVNHCVKRYKKVENEQLDKPTVDSEKEPEQVESIILKDLETETENLYQFVEYVTEPCNNDSEKPKNQLNGTGVVDKNRSESMKNIGFAGQETENVKRKALTSPYQAKRRDQKIDQAKQDDIVSYQPNRVTKLQGVCESHEGLFQSCDDALPMPGDTFVSRQDFLDYVNAHGEKWMFYFRIDYSSYLKTETIFQFTCTYRKHRMPPSKGLRQRTSYKTNCPCRVLLVKFSKDDVFQVRRVCYHHDHELSLDVVNKVIPQIKQVPQYKEIKEEMLDLASLGVDRSIIYKYMYDKTGHENNAIIRHFIYNHTIKVQKNNIQREFSPDKLEALLTKIKEITELYGPKVQEINKDTNKRKQSEITKARKRKKIKLPSTEDSIEEEEEYKEVDCIRKSRLDTTLENIRDDEKVLESVRTLQQSVRNKTRNKTHRETWIKNEIRDFVEVGDGKTVYDDMESNEYHETTKELANTDASRSVITELNYVDNNDYYTVSHQEIVECTEEVELSHEMNEQGDIKVESDEIVLLEVGDNGQTNEDVFNNDNVQISEEFAYPDGVYMTTENQDYNNDVVPDQNYDCEENVQSDPTENGNVETLYDDNLDQANVNQDIKYLDSESTLLSNEINDEYSTEINKDVTENEVKVTLVVNHRKHAANKESKKSYDDTYVDPEIEPPAEIKAEKDTEANRTDRYILKDLESNPNKFLNTFVEYLNKKSQNILAEGRNMQASKDKKLKNNKGSKIKNSPVHKEETETKAHELYLKQLENVIKTEDRKGSIAEDEQIINRFNIDSYIALSDLSDAIKQLASIMGISEMEIIKNIYCDKAVLVLKMISSVSNELTYRPIEQPDDHTPSMMNAESNRTASDMLEHYKKLCSDYAQTCSNLSHIVEDLRQEITELKTRLNEKDCNETCLLNDNCE